MLDFILENIHEISSSLVIVLSIGSFIFLSHRRLHSDIQEVRSDTARAHDRIDAMGIRIDAMGTRIDNLYHVMMAMLTKKDKNK